MGAMILTPGANPAFLTKPFLNRDAVKAGAISVSSGDAFKHRALDMSPNTAATSQGQTAAGDAWTWQGKQYDGSTVNAQPVDFIALLNINFRRFKVEYRVNGGAWSTYAGADQTGADFAADHLILPLNPASPITADEWRITATHTQGSDVEKSLGMFLVGRQFFQSSRGTSDLKPKNEEAIVTVKLMDKSTDQTLLLHNDADFDFFSTPLLFLGVPNAEQASHRALKGTFFLFVPQPGKYPNEWHYCRMIPNSYDASSLAPSSTELRWRIAYQLEDVGTP